ncbi:MAG: hypothetical protein SGPRY_013872, partial [Prymnesium sp.]
MARRSRRLKRMMRLRAQPMATTKEKDTATVTRKTWFKDRLGSQTGKADTPTHKNKMGWDEWKKQILELPENREWSKKELNEWLASGGAFHELPAVLTEAERGAYVREMIRNDIVKKSPVVRAAPVCAQFIDAFQLKRVARFAYRTGVIRLLDNPAEMTCFFASLACSPTRHPSYVGFTWPAVGADQVGQQPQSSYATVGVLSVLRGWCTVASAGKPNGLSASSIHEHF